MKLRNGKNYVFKHKTKKQKTMPEYINEIIDCITQEFALAGLKIIETDYKVVKYQDRPKQ